MRKSGYGIRLVGWGALIVVVVAIAAVAIGYQFKLVGDDRTFIDINSGDLAQDRMILGFAFSRKIVPTEFGNTARAMGLALPDRQWRQTFQHGWLSGTKIDFPMSMADVACRGAVFALRNEKTDADQKKLLAQYVVDLRAGNEKAMEALSRKVGQDQQKRLNDAQKALENPSPTADPSINPATSPATGP